MAVAYGALNEKSRSHIFADPAECSGEEYSGGKYLAGWITSRMVLKGAE